MAHKLDSMDLKQIITLHLDGFSNRKIATTLSIHRNTVNEYIRSIKACKTPVQELNKLDNKKLEAMFPAFTTIDNERFNELMCFFEQVNAARNHPGFTFQYHYHQYRLSHQNPYSYTQFMEHYHRKHHKIRGSVKLEHQPGHEVFIDFAGKKLHVVDKESGEQKAIEVFVAILPNSQYTYVEACLSQKREDLITCMSNALSFYGGVPKAIVSDNLKSAVNRASKYEAQINRTFKDFAQHYGCVVNPTRAYSPQDKALVENAVNLTYQRIYHPLREMTFFSLADLNKEIRKLLERYNDLLFQRKQASRKELFQSVERGYLKPLPATAYQLKDYKRAKVQKMGYVYFSPDKTYYSVPYRYIGKETQIHFTKDTIEVYYYHERIALHHRSPVKGTYITNKDHLSSTHQVCLNWNPDYFKQQALKHGQHVHDFIAGLFREYDYPEVNYKRAMGVIQLAKTYGSERLNKACLRASYGDTYSYNRVKSILEKKLEELPIEQELEATKPHIPDHENIRGASSYQ